MKIADLPSKFPVVWGASAGPSYIRNIPEGSQIGITNGAASLADGFPPLNFLPVGSGGVPPFGQDMNGILRQVTGWSQWQGAGGLVTYDSGFSSAIGGYPFGALLAGTTAGVVWLSTVDDNTSDPDTGGANWTNIGASSSPIMVGADTGSANVVTANVTPVPSAYIDGQVFIIQKVAVANNGGMTGNIQALGSRPIVNMDGTALTTKQWPASGTGILEYNNATSSLRLLNPAVTVAATAGIAATAQQVLSLDIPSLPAPTGALSLSDSIAQQVVSDGAAREVTLAQLAAAIGVTVTALPVAGSRKNLKILTTTISSGTITADELVLEDSTGHTYRASAVNVSYATGTTGANGLDTGTIAASTWYYEWVIYNPTTNTVASLLSLSSTAPTLPAGYTFKARVGSTYYDAGSKLRFKIQYDRRWQYVVGTNPTAGLQMYSGSPNTTPAAIAVGNFFPPTATSVGMIVSCGSGAFMGLAPNASYGAYNSNTNPPPYGTGTSNGFVGVSPIAAFILESSNVYITGASGSTAVFAFSCEENL